VGGVFFVDDDADSGAAVEGARVPGRGKVASRPAGANSGRNCMSNKAMTATVAALSMMAG
jgi:hypothetical protein